MESHSKRPEYLEGAEFIEDKETDEDSWPREPSSYHITLKFRERFNEFGSIINGDIVRDSILYGELYIARRECRAFVRDMDGVTFCIIVSRRPFVDSDIGYTYHAVSIWPYVYDRDKALEEGRWSTRQLNKVEELYRNSTEEEMDEYRVYTDNH